MKRLICLILFLLAFTSVLSSCGEKSDGSEKTDGDPSPEVNGDNHSHSFGEWTVTKNPTCTEYGIEERSCECGETESQSIAPTGHSFGEWIVAKQPTCKEYGIMEKSCTCGAKESASIDYAQHTPLVDQAVGPTCTSTGLTEGSHCSSCGDILVPQSEVPKSSHTYDDKYDESCNACGFVRDAACAHLNQITLPAKDPTCILTGLTEGKKCSKCEEIIVEQKVVKAKGHSNVEGRCTICGNVIYSEGLEFISNGDGTCYLYSTGTCTDSFISIPPTSPEGDVVTRIARIDKTAAHASAITGVRIPSAVTRISERAFDYISELTVIRVSDDNSSFKDIDGILYSKDGTSLIKYPCAREGDNFVIADGITTIGARAFENCNNLQSVYIPSSVTTIKSNAFSSYWLTGVTFGENIRLTDVGSYVFAGSRIKSIKLPSTMQSIPDSIFNGCSRLESIEIPGGVTKIGDSAFSGCSAIKTVTFDGDSKLKSIGARAFERCSSIECIDIPDTVTSIGNNAFDRCTALKEIIIPDGVGAINSGVFSGCIAITEINIPVGASSIGSNAFEGCTALTSISIPDAMTSIGSNAFEGCTALTSISIPDAVTSIGNNAFLNCSLIESVRIGEGSGITSIGSSAFKNCSSLISIDVPDGVSTLGANTFSGCSSLGSVKFGLNSKLVSIGNSVFKNCSNMTDVEIPLSVTLVDTDAFSACTSLTNVYAGSRADWSTMDVKSGNESLLNAIINYSYWYVIYVSNGDGTCYVDGLREGADRDITILPSSPDGDRAVSIGARAFENYKSLYSIAIPYTVTKIDNYAFSGCRVSHITLAENSLLTEIGNYAFNECPNIASVSFENCSQLTMIGNGAFYSCKELDSVSFGEGSSLEKIGALAFKSCVALADIKIPTTTVAIGMEAFSNCAALSELSFGAASALESIGSRAFENCVSLTSVEIPVGVTKIGAYAFGYCPELNRLDFASGSRLTEISEGAFVNCRIESVVIPNGVETIGKMAFYNCVSLENVRIADSTVVIKERAFSECSSLKNVTFGTGGGLEIIEKFAFAGGSALDSMHLPASLKSVGEGILENTGYFNNESNWTGGVLYSGQYLLIANESICGSYSVREGTTVIADFAFRCCKSLQGIEIPFGVTTIGERAFESCESLESITLPDSVNWIEDGAFYDTQYYNDSDNWEDGVLYIGKHLIKVNHYQCQSEYVIKPGTITIAAEAFYSVNNLEHVVIPSTVVSIGDYAFFDCKIQSIYIPESVTRLGEMAVSCGEFLVEIKVAESNTAYKDIDGVLYTKDGTVLIYYPTSKEDTEFVIPDGVVEIANYAFQNATNLVSVYMPDSVRTVGFASFADCTSLCDVRFSLNLVSIGEYAFANCAGFAEAIFGSKITEISSNAFNASKIHILYYEGNSIEWGMIESYNNFYYNIQYNYVSEK